MRPDTKNSSNMPSTSIQTSSGSSLNLFRKSNVLTTQWLLIGSTGMQFMPSGLTMHRWTSTIAFDLTYQITVCSLFSTDRANISVSSQKPVIIQVIRVSLSVSNGIPVLTEGQLCSAETLDTYIKCL